MIFIPRQRLPDWPERLLAAIAMHQAAPFVWGRYDCATFLGDVAHALLGHDPVRLDGSWSCERSALRALQQTGCRDTVEWVRARFPEVPVAEARRGDVGWHGGPRDRLTMPAVIVGAEAISRAADGWVVFPRSLLTEAYAIG